MSTIDSVSDVSEQTDAAAAEAPVSSAVSENDPTEAHDGGDRGFVARIRALIDRSSKWFWFWCALAVACLPMLVPYFADMWAMTHYQYFPFVFLAVGTLIYTRSDGMLYPPRGWVGWTTVAIGLLITATAILNQQVWLGGFGFVVLASGFVAALRGPEDRTLLALSLPLLMLVKLPLGLDELLIQRLQDLTTALASVMLDIFGVSHAIEGNIIKLAERELFVAEACSGIQSVFTLAFLASLLIAFLRRRLWLAPFYFAIAILLAVAGNTVRVTTVALAEVWNGTDLSSGFSHDLLGYTTLALAAALLLSFDRLIITLLHPIEFTSDGMLDNPMARLWNYLVSETPAPDARQAYRSFDEDTRSDEDERIVAPWIDRLAGMPAVRYGFLGLIGILGVASLAQLARMQSSSPKETVYSSEALFTPSANLFGDGFELFKFSDHTTARDGSDPRLGENADLWQVEVGEMQGQVVLSQPYSGWHELCVCYQNLDWDLVDRDVIDDVEIKVMPDTGSDESFVTARFKRPSGQQGYLMFSAISYDGTIPSSPGSFGAFGTRFMGRLDRNGIIDQTDIMMFQFWLPTAKKLEPAAIRKLQEDFVKARAVVAKSVVQPNSDPQPAAPPQA